MRARDNLLTTNRLEALKYHFFNSSWSEFVNSISRNKNRGTLIGKEGSGKTTLLLELRNYLLKEGWQVSLYSLREERRSLPFQFWFKKPDPETFILIDGFEQLSFLERKLLANITKGAGGLVVTSHKITFLPTVIRCDTSPELFEKLTRELGLHYSRKKLESVYRQVDGNIRLGFLALYDEFAGQG